MTCYKLTCYHYSNNLTWYYSSQEVAIWIQNHLGESWYLSWEKGSAFSNHDYTSITQGLSFHTHLTCHWNRTLYVCMSWPQQTLQLSQGVPKWFAPVCLAWSDTSRFLSWYVLSSPWRAHKIIRGSLYENCSICPSSHSDSRCSSRYVSGKILYYPSPLFLYFYWILYTY